MTQKQYEDYTAIIGQIDGETKMMADALKAKTPLKFDAEAAKGLAENQVSRMYLRDMFPSNPTYGPMLLQAADRGPEEGHVCRQGSCDTEGKHLPGSTRDIPRGDELYLLDSRFPERITAPGHGTAGVRGARLDTHHDGDLR